MCRHGAENREGVTWHMNKVELYFFSGTGNSLHIAKELHKKIPDSKLIPIVSSLNKETIKTDAEVVGIIFPLYLTTIPKPVDEFIKKIDLTSVKYSFSVITRIGTFSVANVYINKVLKKRGMYLDSSFIVNMANNSPAGLKPFADQKWVQKISDDKVRALEEKVQANLKIIADCITKREKIYLNGSVSFLTYLLEPIMTKLTRKSSVSIPFYTDKSCTKCMVCEKVCLSGRIKVVDGKIIWDKSVQCYYCYACFNFCPTQSILIEKKYTLQNGRYHHPSIDYKEIYAQKID
jgi:Fe-S-cluster-containing hydrogenase component 2